MEIRTFTADHPDDAARDIRELQQMFADGRIQPYIGARFPGDAATALRHVAERKAVGKVVIDVAEWHVSRSRRSRASLCPDSAAESGACDCDDEAATA